MGVINEMLLKYDPGHFTLLTPSFTNECEFLLVGKFFAQMSPPAYWH
jgi:hypothetical protein